MDEQIHKHSINHLMPVWPHVNKCKDKNSKKLRMSKAHCIKSFHPYMKCSVPCAKKAMDIYDWPRGGKMTISYVCLLVANELMTWKGKTQTTKNNRKKCFHRDENEFMHEMLMGTSCW